MPLTVHLATLPGVPPADLRAAVQAAADSWSATSIDCTGLQFSLSFEDGPGPAAGNDGTNALGARADDWCEGAAPSAPSRACNDPSAVAVTSVFADADSGDFVVALFGYLLVVLGPMRRRVLPGMKG